MNSFIVAVHPFDISRSTFNRLFNLSLGSAQAVPVISLEAFQLKKKILTFLLKFIDVLPARSWPKQESKLKQWNMSSMKHASKKSNKEN